MQDVLDIIIALYVVGMTALVFRLVKCVDNHAICINKILQEHNDLKNKLNKD